jgi:pimeloyl-ACP methyl ester carboxylesterase
MRPVVILCALAALACGPARAGEHAQSQHVDCRGVPTAAPTVVVESGAFGTSSDWGRVLDDLAEGGRVCAYDRAGVGASPPRAGPEDVTSIAEELASLLDRLGETRPVILVGHSNGALYAETFAALWPERVAGLVYVNGVTSNDLTDPRLVADLTRERHLSELAADAGALGLARLAAPSIVRSEQLPPRAAARKLSALTHESDLRVARDEDRAIIPGLFIAAGLGGSPPQIPTVVLMGSTDPDGALSKAWWDAEAEAARRAKTSWILRAVGATHTSPLSRDRAWLVAAVNWLRSLPAPPP